VRDLLGRKIYNILPPTLAFPCEVIVLSYGALTQKERDLIWWLMT